jgi:DNA-binding beta-propeller fold protein YncE
MRYINLLLLSLVLFSCEKKKNQVNSSSIVPKNGLLVLCEGLFQQNNAALSWVNFEDESIDNQYFENKNGRLLGDTGNDMEIYGGKIYIVVNVSSTIEVLDKATNVSLKQIDMKVNGVAKSPRQIKFHNGFGFITCFDGYVDVLDTATLTITKRIKVGDNPEGLSFSNDKLYVANSGGLNVPNVDSTLSVIDLTSLVEVKKITVGKNPGSVQVDNEGDIYVIARGNYSSIPSRMIRIDTQNDIVSETFDFDASGITVMGNKFLIRYYNFNTLSSNISLFDTENESIVETTFINDAQFTTLYGVFYNASNKKIYCTDAMSYTNTGYVKVFNNQGVFEKSYHVGLNPNSIIFYE